jgi:hypothetical protein
MQRTEITGSCKCNNCKGLGKGVIICPPVSTPSPMSKGDSVISTVRRDFSGLTKDSIEKDEHSLHTKNAIVGSDEDSSIEETAPATRTIMPGYEYWAEKDHGCCIPPESTVVDGCPPDYRGLLPYDNEVYVNKRVLNPRKTYTSNEGAMQVQGDYNMDNAARALGLAIIADGVLYPGSKAPEVNTSEVNGSEVNTSEVKIPEVKAPEVKASEIKVPEIKKKESMSSANSGSSSGSSRGKKFLVSFGDKEGHPWSEYNQVNSSIYVNGKNGPVLHLYRGCNYFFVIDQKIVVGKKPEHSFVLTTSPVGGKDSLIVQGGFDATANGTVKFQVDDDTPRYLFYQDGNVGFKGGLVIVHDQ